MDAHVDVHAQAGFGDRRLGLEIQQIGRDDVDFGLLLVELVGAIAEHLDKLLHRRLNQPRVRDPAAVVAVGGITSLVGNDAGHGDLVPGRIVLDRDQRAHAADGRRAALVAGLEQQQRVGTHERRGHRDLGAIGQAELVVELELLDAAEDVVPAAGVQTGAVLAQFVEDFFHLECSQDGFDQHGRLDRALRQAQLALRHHEHVVPQPCFEVAFHLRQIEERTGAARDLLLRVVEHEQGKVEDAAAHALAVDQHMLFIEVPAARTHLQRGDLVVEPVGLAVGLERERAADGLAEVDLALNLVRPQRRVAVFEVGHVAVGTRVEGVDDHLGLDGAGDLHTTALQRRRNRRDLPVAFADGFRLGQKVGALAGIEPLAAFDARCEQLLAAWLEGPVQLGHQFERGQAEDGLEARTHRRVDLHARRQAQRGKAHQKNSFKGSKKFVSSRRLRPMRVGSMSREWPGSCDPDRGASRACVNSGAQAGLHEGLAVVALLAGGFSVAGLHLVLLSGLAVARKAFLHEGLAVVALLVASGGIAGRHLVLLLRQGSASGIGGECGCSHNAQAQGNRDQE